jgi:hypothetical membrane protein
VNLTRIGIVFFAAAALTGPWYTFDGYGFASNLISQLGAQNTQNNFIMIIGFLALGIGMIAEGFQKFSTPKIPFIAFGLCMTLVGLFAHKPIDPTVPYSEFMHQAHGALAMLAGISITAGLLWQAFLVSKPLVRTITIILATLCLVLPLCMLVFQDIQGLIQRLMYLLIFTWLWINYPGKILATRPRS